MRHVRLAVSAPILGMRHTSMRSPQPHGQARIADLNFSGWPDNIRPIVEPTWEFLHRWDHLNLELVGALSDGGP